MDVADRIKGREWVRRRVGGGGGGPTVTRILKEEKKKETREKVCTKKVFQNWAFFSPE